MFHQPLASNLPIQFFTFEGGVTTPLDDGTYYGVAHAIVQMTAGTNVETSEPDLQLFATDACVPLFVFSSACIIYTHKLYFR